MFLEKRTKRRRRRKKVTENYSEIQKGDSPERKDLNLQVKTTSIKKWLVSLRSSSRHILIKQINFKNEKHVTSIQAEETCHF